MEADIRIKGKVHFIGIGGCSMNGLAQILKSRGFEVDGSDSATSPFTERLAEVGIPVKIGHSALNVEGCDTVIYSAAIKPDNPERVRAKELGIPQIERSVALGLISEGYDEVIGISGCHGKTTITSMLALIAEEGGLDATVHVGGMVDFLHGGIRLGSRELFVTEACEYVESFLTLHPTVVLINNIDDDHLDYFRDIDHITDAFRKFIRRMPEDGLLIGCTDDIRVRGLLKEYGGRELTYGLDTAFDPDYYPVNESYDELGCPSFDLMRRNECLGRITLHVPGRHNMLDAVAAAAVALSHGTKFTIVAGALSHFHSVKRRFEYYGERGGVRIFHDYAHHPAEIRAALDCGMRTPHERMFIVFQCNSYTRAKTLFTGAVDCFEGATKVLVPDIYPGREKDDGSVHARDMVDAINAVTDNAKYIPTFEQINDYLMENARPGDIVITLGSGDVYKRTNLFCE
ncbi:MAG: UDP-N-acetylmuramate--L-alanine ligase [Christensenellaceae bacterium]|nr:UDP-N-acetylmuramate--L-alanine ligase [Christensenellaceae bacterium]